MSLERPISKEGILRAKEKVEGGFHTRSYFLIQEGSRSVIKPFNVLGESISLSSSIDSRVEIHLERSLTGRGLGIIAIHILEEVRKENEAA